ncbi:MAG TPA: hypothetical protein VL793_14255 [Patescibacteria group bacterium]|jgi:hypothetical protein|nr:hypothetical protein [Patescibacteria group bacterium]
MAGGLEPTPLGKTNKRVQVGIAAVLVIISATAVWRFLREPEPTFQGKPVSFWYESLCTGVFVGTQRAPNFDKAYEGFRKMGPEMVPYLTSRLRYDRSGYREKVIRISRKIPFLKGLAKRMILPTERRCYAAVALRQMGPSAKAAIPDLMEVYVNDSPRVGLNAIAALGAILDTKLPEGQNMRQLADVKNQILAQAAQLCPRTAAQLGLKVDAPRR